jgi:hypothetical protein
MFTFSKKEYIKYIPNNFFVIKSQVTVLINVVL